MFQGCGGECDVEMVCFWFEQGVMGGDGESCFLLVVIFVCQVVDVQDEDMLGQVYCWVLLVYEDFIGYLVDEVCCLGLQVVFEMDLLLVLCECICLEVDVL